MPTRLLKPASVAECVRTACVAIRLQRSRDLIQALLPVGSCGLISTYSGINISRRQAQGIMPVFLNLREATRTGFKGPGPIVQARVGITDEAGTTVHGLRETQRTGIAC